MKIDIHCKGMPLTDAIQNHVEDKLGKLKRMLPDGITPSMTLHSVSESHGGSYLAEITFRVWGQDIVSKSSADDLYKAINDVADQVTNQLRRAKEKRETRRKKGSSVREYIEPEPVTSDSIDELEALEAMGVDDVDLIDEKNPE